MGIWYKSEYYILRPNPNCCVFVVHSLKVEFILFLAFYKLVSIYYAFSCVKILAKLNLNLDYYISSINNEVLYIIISKYSSNSILN